MQITRGAADSLVDREGRLRVPRCVKLKMTTASLTRKATPSMAATTMRAILCRMHGPIDSVENEASALGSALGSQYELVRVIGSGGMGRVYLAREPLLDRQVAVKVLPAEVAATSDARERF